MMKKEPFEGKVGSILLAGGAGYIGSHTAVELIKAGYEVVIVDNFANSSPEVINRIERITGVRPAAYEADIKNANALNTIFERENIGAVIHLAGLKAVGESIEQPVQYYRNNIDTTLTLLEIMEEAGCKNIVFSSSATIYGEEAPVPYTEELGRGKCTNPYGWTKSMSEQILEDAAHVDKEMSVVLLRYFNPIGADESGLIGEDPKGTPNNLMPYVSQVAAGKREKLTVFGNDYDTPDGTCRRDFIHVTDLAKGHGKAVEYAVRTKGVEIFNMGTGTPYSVVEIVDAYEKANGVKINLEFGPRREGDLPEIWADASKAERILGWKAEKGIDRMCRDSWNWQKNNPEGYK